MNVDGLDALRAMRMGVSYFFDITVRSFQITMRPLSQSEFLQMTAEVSAELRASPEDHQNRMAEELCTARKILIRASTSDIDTNDPKMTEAVLLRMTIPELLAIYKQYNAKCDELDPSIDNLTVPQIKDLIAQLKKNDLRPKDLPLPQLQAILNFFLTAEESQGAK